RAGGRSQRGPRGYRRGAGELAADPLDQGTEEVPGFVVVDGSGVRLAEPVKVHGDVGDVPAEAVEVEESRPRDDARRVGVGLEDAPVAGIEAPQVAFWRGDQGGIPVDEPPAPGSQHGVAGMG